MTVVAGYAQEGRVWMACDTLTVDAWDLKGSIDSKIVRRPVSGGGEVLLGVSGDAQLIPLLRHELEVPAAPDPRDVAGSDEWAWGVARAITTLCAESKPALMRATGGDGQAQNASVLLGHAGAMWSCATNQAWRVIGPFMAIGSGDNLALGALHALGQVDRGLGPQERLFLAVQAACQFDLHCGGDLHVEVLG